MKIKIFIIAGEASGDNLANILLIELKKLLIDHDLEISGIFGEKVEALGYHSLFPIEELSVMGFSEVLPKVFSILKRIKYTAREINKWQPNIVLTIDSPDFCFRVVKKIDPSIKRIHYVAPSVWAYRPKRAELVARLYNHLFTLLPFEPPYFTKFGLDATFVGHPIHNNQKIRRINKNKRSIIITLGSRAGEIKKMAPTLLEAANKIADCKPVLFATKTTEPIVKALNSGLQIIVLDEEKAKIIASADLVIAKSGTNVMEFLYQGLPVIACYKVSFVSFVMMKILTKVKYATIVNIMANRELVPEFLQYKCRSDLIALCAEQILTGKKQYPYQAIAKEINSLASPISCTSTLAAFLTQEPK